MAVAAALQADVAALCAQGGVIVHPLDGVPWPVTAALLAHSTAAGFEHLFWHPQLAAPRVQALQAALPAEKKQKLVIDGNAFYEIDLRCLEKKRKKQEEAKKRQQKRQRR